MQTHLYIPLGIIGILTLLAILWALKRPLAWLAVVFLIACGVFVFMKPEVFTTASVTAPTTLPGSPVVSGGQQSEVVYDHSIPAASYMDDRDAKAEDSRNSDYFKEESNGRTGLRVTKTPSGIVTYDAYMDIPKRVRSGSSSQRSGAKAYMTSDARVGPRVISVQNRITPAPVVTTIQQPVYQQVFPQVQQTYTPPACPPGVTASVIVNPVQSTPTYVVPPTVVTIPMQTPQYAGGNITVRACRNYEAKIDRFGDFVLRAEIIKFWKWDQAVFRKGTLVIEAEIPAQWAANAAEIQRQLENLIADYVNHKRDKDLRDDHDFEDESKIQKQMLLDEKFHNFVKESRKRKNGATDWESYLKFAHVESWKAYFTNTQTIRTE